SRTSSAGSRRCRRVLLLSAAGRSGRSTAATSPTTRKPRRSCSASARAEDEEGRRQQEPPAAHCLLALPVLRLAEDRRHAALHGERIPLESGVARIGLVGCGIGDLALVLAVACWVHLADALAIVSTAPDGDDEAAAGRGDLCDRAAVRLPLADNSVGVSRPRQHQGSHCSKGSRAQHVSSSWPRQVNRFGGLLTYANVSVIELARERKR